MRNASRRWLMELRAGVTCPAAMSSTVPLPWVSYRPHHHVTCAIRCKGSRRISYCVSHTTSLSHMPWGSTPNGAIHDFAIEIRGVPVGFFVVVRRLASFGLGHFRGCRKFVSAGESRPKAILLLGDEAFRRVAPVVASVHSGLGKPGNQNSPHWYKVVIKRQIQRFASRSKHSPIEI